MMKSSAVRIVLCRRRGPWFNQTRHDPAHPRSSPPCAGARSRLVRMSPETITVILKRFETPDEVREMVKGRFEVVRLGGLTIGRATYEPGWRWSEHVGPALGASRCTVAHVGLVLS